MSHLPVRPVRGRRLPTPQKRSCFPVRPPLGKSRRVGAGRSFLPERAVMDPVTSACMWRAARVACPSRDDGTGGVGEMRLHWFGLIVAATELSM